PRAEARSGDMSPHRDDWNTSFNFSLTDVYETLLTAFGPQHWWPAKGPEEMIIGALLTQNTTWNNVEKALSNLRKNKLLSFSAILCTTISQLEERIRPSGYFRQKSQRLMGLAEAIVNTGGLQQLKTMATPKLREWFLNRKGVGPETADSILLYAFNRPTFIIDTYTLRVCKRHQWLQDSDDYTSAQEMFMQKLPEDVAIYNEFHALLVQIGKNFCRANNPLCHKCPLGEFLDH
ncbi:hypothetical protein KAI46_11560, partial [bacterium]|nr:hypothetical protein [bacterium]